MSSRSRHKKPQYGRAGGNLQYPFQADNVQRQMQKQIERDRGRRLEVGSDLTSVYEKDSLGMLRRVNRPEIRYHTLPGLPGHDDNP